MPPMPPAPGAPAAAAFLSSSLMSAMRASVVSIKPAMDAAFCSARRVTLAGSITPILTMSPYSPVSALKPKFSSLESRILPITTAPSWPALRAIWREGSSRARFTMPTPTASSSCSFNFSIAEMQRSRAGGVHSIFDTGLLFLQLGFGGCADFDDGDAADQLGKALLELFLVVIAGGVFDLRADLLHTAFDVRGLAGAFDDRGVVLVDDDLLGATEVLKLHVLELDAEVFGDGLAAREGGDVFEHGLAAVAKARGLDGGALQSATELIHHEGGKRFAFDVLSDDQEGLAHLGGLLEQREQVLHGADFLFVNEDAHVLEHAFHALRVGDEVGGEIAAVKLHAFDYFEGGLHCLGFLDGDDAILADLLHGLGDDAADLLVVVGGNGANLGDHVALDVLVELLDLFDGHFDGAFDAALESGRAGAGGDSLDALAEDSLCEHGRGGRAVTGNVGSLGSDFADHLRAHVFEWIAEFDFFCHSHAVLGNDRRAELLLDHRVAALGAEGNLHCVGKNVHTTQNRLAGILTCNNLLRHTSNSS